MTDNNFLQFSVIHYLNLLKKRANIKRWFHRKQQFHLKNILYHKQRINFLIAYLFTEKRVNRIMWIHVILFITY